MSVLNLSGSAGIKALIDELEKLVDDKWSKYFLNP